MKRTSPQVTEEGTSETYPTEVDERKRAWKPRETKEWVQHKRDEVIKDTDENSVKAAVFVLVFIASILVFLEAHSLVTRRCVINVLWYPIIQETHWFLLISFVMSSTALGYVGQAYFFTQMKRNHVLRKVYKLDPYTRAILDHATNPIYSSTIIETLDEEVLLMIGQCIDQSSGMMNYLETVKKVMFQRAPEGCISSGGHILSPYEEFVIERPHCTKTLEEIRKTAVEKMCEQITTLMIQNAPLYGYYSITTTSKRNPCAEDQ